MIAQGLLAGAAGTMALDLYTYADMLASARPASTVPSEVVRELANRAGIASLTSDDDAAANRRSAAGALMGYGVGLGAGVAYTALRPAFRAWLPWPVAGLLLGAATLVTSEGTATRLGATDWNEWSASEWAADILPRSLYGLVTAYVVERLAHGLRDEDAEADAAMTATIAPSTLAEGETLDPLFTTPVVPGREHATPPIDPVALEADREVNPKF